MMTWTGKIKRGFSVFILLFGTGCTSHEAKLYEGKVVDEQGVPIQDVSITLCYLGWGWDWSMAGGFPLIMGKSFCSDPVITDQLGNYKVFFSGPPSTFILARHPGWIQVKSLLATDNRVVLVRKDIEIWRHAEQKQRKEKAFRRKKSNESDVEYYCRVIRKNSHKVELIYRGYRIKVVEALLVGIDKTTFAVAGPYDALLMLADDLIISEKTIDGARPLLDNFVALPEKVQCGKNYFIQSRGYSNLSTLEKASSVDVEIPSLRAVFTMQIWVIE